MPDLRYEKEAGGLVVGIDEVGRGPLAGPVVAACVCFRTSRLPRGLRSEIMDSKAMTAAARVAVLGPILAHAWVGVAGASAAEVDRINVLQASFLAMARALAASRLSPDLALVDGNLAPPLPCPVRPVVRGDGISLSIAAASIVAKVTRDRLMARLASRYPHYGWERNAGYGTLEHRDALTRYGPTRHHRMSFSPLSQLALPNL